MRLHDAGRGSSGENQEKLPLCGFDFRNPQYLQAGGTGIPVPGAADPGRTEAGKNEDGCGCMEGYGPDRRGFAGGTQVPFQVGSQYYVWLQ